MQPVEIALERGGRIHGRVVDAAGAPVDGVRVTAGQWRVPRGQYPLPRGTFSDADGRFELRELPLEGNTSLSFNKRGNYMFTRLSDVEPREEPYELTLHAPTRIDGQVVDDETGEPISRFELVQGMQGRGSELVFADRGRRTVNSATGSFSQQAQRVMASPPYPKMAVRVRANGYLPAETEAVPVGERLEGVVIRLKRGEPITGRATTPQGEPARDAEVAWVGPARTAFIRDGRLTEMYTHAAEVVERTDRQGRFRLPASAEPGVIVVVHASGYRVLSHETLLEEEGQVPLLSWARIEGRTGFDIPPGDQVAVTARLVEEPPLEERPPVSWIFHTHAQPDARFLMEHVPAEPMVIYLADGGGAAEVTPRAGETSTVRIGRAPTPHTPPAQ